MTVIMFKKIGIVILIITITDDLKRKKAPIDLYFDNLGGLAMPPPKKNLSGASGKRVPYFAGI